MSKRKRKEKISPLKGSYLWGILIFCMLVLIDLITKAAAQAYFSAKPAGHTVWLIGDWIGLCITYNRGIAYGIGNDSSTWVKLTVIIGTAILMLVLAVIYFKIDGSRIWIRTALAFIVAGGVGNLIDRVYYRVWDPASAAESALIADGVRDMVNLDRLGFAVCNFADFFITGGAVVLVLAMLFFDKDAVFPVGKYKKMSQKSDLVEFPTETDENHG